MWQISANVNKLSVDKNMQILELNFSKDNNEKYLNFSAKYRLNIHKLEFDII